MLENIPLKSSLFVVNRLRQSCYGRFVVPVLLVGICATFFVSDCQAFQGSRNWEAQRRQMVDLAVVDAGVTDSRVIDAMRATKRHEFVPRHMRQRSYLDAGVPIGHEQTISSPFIVAYMTQTLAPKTTDKVLEIGTGSGYQAAVLSPLVKEVYSIEIVEPLGIKAAKVLKKLKYKNVFTKIGDGYLGWQEHAPFDKIIVTCSPEDIPRPLVDQLKEGGMIVVPIGERHQQTLYQMVKQDGEMVQQALRPTLFVPMTGEAESTRKVKPDPANPVLLNGDFEAGVDKSGFVKGWYYQRQLTVKQDDAPSGKNYVEFTNRVPGQYAHVMQGIAIDGRKVPTLAFSARLSSDNVIQGNSNEDVPVASITFYNAQRKDLTTTTLGPVIGTTPWKELAKSKIRVPIATREAIVRIGLFGATGVVRFDDVHLSTAGKK